MQKGKRTRSPAKGKSKKKLAPNTQQRPAVTMRNFVIGGKMPLNNSPEKTAAVNLEERSISATYVEPMKSAKPTICQVSDYESVKKFMKMWLESTDSKYSCCCNYINRLSLFISRPIGN